MTCPQCNNRGYYYSTYRNKEYDYEQTSEVECHCQLPKADPRCVHCDGTKIIQVLAKDPFYGRPRLFDHSCSCYLRDVARIKHRRAINKLTQKLSIIGAQPFLEAYYLALETEYGKEFVEAVKESDSIV